MRRPRHILIMLPLIVALAWLSLFSTAPLAPVAGRGVARVIDGDTLEIGGVRVDLYGIDAPELGQVCRHNGSLWRCGESAAFALHKVIEVSDQPVRCEPWGVGGERGSTCRIGQRDLGNTLIQSGDVVALPDAFPEYREAETRARASGLGLWRGRFVMPSDWRAGRRLAGEAGAAPPCPVKGVVSNGGAKTIHVPTDEGYTAVVIDPAKGGMCFESDAAALAAGWGPPAPTWR